MSRIRTIKPEFWTSEKIVELSTTARLLFIGLWNFCDDGGVHPASCKTLKMEVFPGDDFTSSDIETMMAAIISATLVVEYEALDGKKYWKVCGWEAHQKVDRPNFKHPQPELIDGQSTNNRRAIDEQTPPEGKGREGKGREKEWRGGEFDEPARAGESQNENTPTALPHSAFEKVRTTIQRWQGADNGAALRKIAQDQKFMGPIEPEITRFITNNLGKSPYRERILKDPLGFFLEQFPGWLCLPAAQRASKAHASSSGYTAPMQRQTDADKHMSRSDAADLIRQHAGEYAGMFTEKHIEDVRSKIGKRTAIDLILAIAKTIQNGHSPPHPKGNATEISPHGLK